MFNSLSIQNFALIDNLELDFNNGMTALTGETGAGKSIIIDALLLALGARADVSLIAHGQERCSISAHFAVKDFPVALQWLQDNELSDQTECLLRRVLFTDGRSKSFINGQNVTAQQLRELSNLLISVHGQHEYQTLLKTEKQRYLLDCFADHLPLCEQVQNLYQSWQKACTQLNQLKEQQNQRVMRRELLQHYLEEFTQLNLQSDEAKLLDEEQLQLANAENILLCCQQLQEILAESAEGNVLALLTNAYSQLDKMASQNAHVSTLKELLTTAQIQVKEALTELRHYQDHVEINPERLQWVEERLVLIHNLARKHKVAAHELLALQQALENENQQLLQTDSQSQQLEMAIQQLSHDYQEAAAKLTANRNQAIKKFTSKIAKILQQLNMPHARFSVVLTPLAAGEFSRFGLERIEFLISTNPGQSLQSLTKIVSGGELSRICLAIHVLTTQKDTVPTLIFDEVDVGIGGATAAVVGRLLRELAAKTQILCITHLPQVAAQAHYQLRIDKKITASKTTISIQNLDTKKRIEEIARMLGGIKITQQTLAHAQELLIVDE